MAKDVFLSYAAADKATALAVLAGLEDSGIGCWIAPRDIPAGSEYGEQIVDAIKACRIVVVIFSAGANASPHVRREVERAVSAQRPIVPFRVENIAPTGAMEIALSNTHWLDAMSAPLEPHIATLVTMLGETEPAFDLLERLLPLANEEIKSWVKVDVDLEALRPLPRYQKLLELIQ